MSVGDWANVIAAVAGAVSAIAAFFTIRRSIKERSDDRLLAYATKTIERAYNALVGEARPVDVKPDPLAWLTSARLIEEYKKAKSRIRDKVALHECEGHEEHWRHQFYLALRHLQQIHPEYYSTRRSRSVPIHPISAVIIHAFATWPEEKADPLDAYKTTDEAVSALKVHLKWFSLRRYLGLLK